MSSSNVVDNESSQRFELEVHGSTATAEYTRNGDTLTFTHTVVPHEFRDQGVGTELARGALDQARAAGRKVIAQCSFIARFIKDNPEYQDLVAER